MKRAAIGVSAHLGWAATSVVVPGKNGLRVLRTDRIESAEPGDREASEPFHVAGGFHGLRRVPRPADPKAVRDRGLRMQRRQTERAVRRLAKALEHDGFRLTCAGILVSRGRPADDLERAIGSHTQIHIEEGLAVRESFRLALAAIGARNRDLDQKTVWSIASDALKRSPAAVQAALREALPENAGPWRKEEKTAALAAWIAWERSR
jgi:hypothetical protein